MAVGADGAAVWFGEEEVARVLARMVKVEGGEKREGLGEGLQEPVLRVQLGGSAHD